MANSQRETEETTQIREASRTHRPNQPSHPEPQHNRRHKTRFTHSRQTSETYTQRRWRHMSRLCLPLKIELQPHRQERPHTNHQTQTEHDQTETWKPTMARHDHAMARRQTKLPQTIPPEKQSRIRLQLTEEMLRQLPIQPQKKSPKTRTPPQNPQLQHRNSQPHNHQRRKQITFHSPSCQKR